VTLSEVTRAIDTVVEIVDLTTGALVHSERFSEVFGGFVESGQVLELFADAAGDVSIRVLRLSLAVGADRLRH
jgi:hypothetical protein